MQCRICYAELPAGSVICPSCQALVQIPPEPFEPTESFAENTIFREYTEPSVQPSQSPTPYPAYAPAPPMPAYSPLGIPPITARQPKRWGKFGLTLAFILVLVVAMSTGSLFTILFLQHSQHPTTTNISSTELQQKIQKGLLDYGTVDPQALYSSVTSQKPIDTDPLNDPGKSYWETSSPLSDTRTFSCQFANGSFHVIETRPRYFYYCPSGQIYENFVFQVEVNILKGYAGGLTFRSSSSTHTYYVWRVDSTGTYHLTAYNGHGTSPVILEGSRFPYFKSGYDQKNLLTVIAHGTDILLYINQHFVNRVKDKAFVSGYAGLLAYNGGTTTEVSFTNASFWILP